MSAPAAVARAFALVDALIGHSRNGLRLRAIAAAVGQSEPTTLRDLQALAHLGYAERIPGNEECWHLTPRLVQLALAMQHEIAREEQKLADFSNRYTRSPH